MLELSDIQRATERLRGHLLVTPCVASRTLSDIVGAQIFLKFENLQFTASFKERGACNKLAQLTPQERQRGVIAMSAGNHAQGVAYHAQRLGIRAVIVMPRLSLIHISSRARGDFFIKPRRNEASAAHMPLRAYQACCWAATVALQAR